MNLSLMGSCSYPYVCFIVSLVDCPHFCNYLQQKSFPDSCPVPVRDLFTLYGFYCLYSKSLCSIPCNWHGQQSSKIKSSWSCYIVMITVDTGEKYLGTSLFEVCRKNCFLKELGSGVISFVVLSFGWLQ